MYFFVFKQKTAYEMRISDWSSDVCSSDLSLKYYHELLAQLRAGKEPEAEPIPVGTAQIYGAVESLEMKEGGCVVRGWFVDTQGAVPAAVVLRVNGASYGTDDLERTSRPDVQRQFGLAEDRKGAV